MTVAAISPWAQAWGDRVVEPAAAPTLDRSLLTAGRRLARKVRDSGQVVVEVEPLRAAVRLQIGSEAIATSCAFRPLSDDAWAAMFDSVRAAPAKVAQLLTGELPFPMGTSSEGLLPDVDEVSSTCSCHEWADNCRHRVALLVLVGDVIQRDPFTLLLLRGGGRESLVSAVGGEASGEPRGIDAGIDPGLAFAREPGPLPRPRSMPRRVSRPAPLGPTPPADSGLVADDLIALVQDAAGRALELLNGESDGGLRRTVDEDLVRRAANYLDDPTIFGQFAAAAKMDQTVLRQRATAWRCGGPAGLRAFDHRWDPTQFDLAPGRLALQRWQPAARVRSSGNTLIMGAAQLRLDANQQWWRLQADPNLGWLLVAGGFDDPEDALD